MSRLRLWIRGFFGFSRVETNAFLIMLPLMGIIVFSQPIYRAFFVRYGYADTGDKKILDSLVATWKWESQSDVPMFLFDPNTASGEDLMKLGLPQNLSKRVISYRAKGGKFRVKSDLNKIYGMDSALLLKLTPFISLPDLRSERLTILGRKPAQVSRSGMVKKIFSQSFDLNLADTAQLSTINGIGPKLSVRITTYRGRLGGFISVEQLREVYGLDSTVIARVKSRAFISPDFKPRQLNINTANARKMTELPYLKFPLAKAIAAYRFQHGEFSTVDDLHKIVMVDAPTFEKIKPYITVKD